MILYYDARATEYGAAYHPERPARLLGTEKLLRELHPDWEWRTPRIASDDEILRAHSPEHLARLLMAFDFDTDTPAYPGIADHARRAAGAALEVVDRALDRKKSFSLMRPPGHHATRNRAMGFCYLNSVAIAALYALSGGCERVAIWDFDAHHGNGTESIVQGDQRIRFASIHQLPGYPGSGATSFDNILNYPIPPNADPEYHIQEAAVALQKLTEFHPDLLLVSAGFDAFAGDPITDMTLEKEHFALFGSWLANLRIPVGAILEGGYSGELPLLVDAFLNHWIGQKSQ
jgi:acetoin utilization deacetylase AcuC-like enzyme